MNVAQYILTIGIRLYRWGLSPVKTLLFGPGGRCRFEPSCSGYALEAVATHGAVKGSALAVKRLCRCHPWGDFGPDPVPPKISKGSRRWFRNSAPHSRYSFQAPLSPGNGKPCLHLVRPH